MVITSSLWEGHLPVAVSLCQLVLAAVFAVAGAAKLRDLAETRRAVAGFGAPAPLQAPLAVVLPLVELAIAGALFVPALARWAALAALALLLVFCAVIVRALARGSAPDCNCFGGLTQTEVGRGTLARNLLLGALAAFAAFGTDEPMGALGWIGHVAARDRVPAIVIGVLVAAQLALGWFCWAVLRQNGRLLLQLEARGSGPMPPDRPLLAAGEPAPDFAAATADGEAVSLASLLAPELPVALVFADTHCGACEQVLAQAAHGDRDGVTVAVVMRGDAALARERAGAFGLPRVIPDPHDALFEAFGVRGAPGTLLLDSQGRVASPVKMGADPARDALASAGTEPVVTVIGGAA
jgi:uncharacterized membrane protein YphA (DoxX/SURF4 family)/peroxiredoxin